jgi:hypothetical protein
MAYLYEQRSPWEQNWERLCRQSLLAAFASPDELRETRPNLPSVELIRDRFGYPVKQEREMSMDQIVDVPRLYQDRRFDVSGGPGGYQGSERNVNQSMSW